jgi:hypothetical protein
MFFTQVFLFPLFRRPYSPPPPYPPSLQLFAVSSAIPDNLGERESQAVGGE